MSNNVVADFGIDIGKNVQEGMYLKVKVGKGSSEVKTLKQTVEQGTGKELNDSQHTVSVWCRGEADIEDLKENASNMVEGIQVQEGLQGGKWLQLNLADTPFYDEGSEEKLNEFFKTVQNNAFVELNLKTTATYADLATQAKAQNEDGELEGEGPYPSWAALLNGLAFHLKCDIDHEFVIGVLEFVRGLGAPITPEFFGFVKKASNITMNVAFNGVDELDGEIRNWWSKMMREQGHAGIKMGLQMGEMGLEFGESFKVYFILKDDAFVYVDAHFPGLKAYAEAVKEKFINVRKSS